MFNMEKSEKCPYCNNDTVNIEKGNEKNNPIVLQNENKTMAYWVKENSCPPVVGWLVCIQGSEKGKDYRIINERNFIGRSEKMHINIENDLNVARKNHASITYNPKQRIFILTPGEATSLIYLQNKALYESKQIFNNDIIEIGQSRYIFIALCGGNFDWNI